MVSSQALELALLPNAQQHYLHFARQFADFVQKKRAAVSLAEEAFAAFHRPGERAAFVPESFGCRQRGWDGGAVDLDQRPLGSRRAPVNGARDGSLPVPVSPVISTEASVGATCSTKAFAIAPASAVKYPPARPSARQ